MKKLINILPWLIVAALLFRYWVDSQPTTTVVEVPQNPNTIVDPAAGLPEFKVVPGSVYDGDTIRVVPMNVDGFSKDQQLRIRFACIDAPERSQPGGLEARDELKRLLQSDRNIVKLNIITTDRYGRNVAEVWNGYGLVQSQLTAGGFVYPYEQYKSDCPNWDAVKYSEDWAKKNKLGVWGNPNAVKPWDYRKK